MYCATEDQENMAALQEWYMSMFKDEAIEGYMRMQPYEEHVQFKYCLALPKMVEMMGEMMEMGESPAGAESPSISEWSESDSSDGKSGYEEESDSESRIESMPEGGKGEGERSQRWGWNQSLIGFRQHSNRKRRDIEMF